MSIPELIQSEKEYQQQQLKLIPSENYVSPAVMEAVGSILMNKYAEGQAGKRYYHGNKNTDSIERLCKERALEVFGLTGSGWSVNVQAVTGSVANLAVYTAILQPGDPILSLYLPDGGHLSHGWVLPGGKPVSFTGRIFNSHFYNVSTDTYLLDYDEIRKKAKKVKPKLIISGGTAYPRVIDFKKLSEIAHEINAQYMADVAHESGLIAGGSYPSPFEYADIVTMTTRKTLRGPIGALIFTRDADTAEKIDRAVFPGLQGGPMMNSIAGISVALEEAGKPSFAKYTSQIIKNAAALAQELQERGFMLMTGGTDTHLILMDITNKQPDGYIAAEMLETVDIITNKNTIPAPPEKNDHIAPWRPHGLRLGTPAITTRGMKEDAMETIADLIDRTLSVTTFPAKTPAPDIREQLADNKEIAAIRNEVHALTAAYPIYQPS
jgi:glycine hydroxymethyltransferase